MAKILTVRIALDSEAAEEFGANEAAADVLMHLARMVYWNPDLLRERRTFEVKDLLDETSAYAKVYHTPVPAGPFK